MLRRLACFMATFALISVVQADLRSSLSGKSFGAVFPGDSAFAGASQAYNYRYTFTPAVVTTPNTPQDVSTIIQAAAANGFQVAARSGGHSYIANGVGGRDNVVILDMKNFNSISIDSSTNTAVIGMGNRIGDIALALNNQGRALPHGTSPHVGIGGQSSYGGFGLTGRMWGLTLDSILSLDVVLANGTITTISSTSNPDLYFAMRGAGPSFAVTTAIHVQTYAAPSTTTIFGYDWDLSAADALSALTRYQTFGQTNLPKELTLQVTLQKGSSSGRLTFSFGGGYYGPTANVDGLLAPFMSQMSTPTGGEKNSGNYLNSLNAVAGGMPLNSAAESETHDTFYVKSLLTSASSPLSTAALTNFIYYLAFDGFTTQAAWFIQIDLFGGQNSAITGAGVDSNAFAHRNSLFLLQLYAYAPSNNPPYPADGFTLLDDAVNKIVSNSPAGWDYGAHLNYIDDRLSNWQNQYYGSHYTRLQAIKNTFDPNGMFTFPNGVQGAITPTSPSGSSVTIHPNGNTNKCLDVQGATFADGTPVQIFDCNGTGAQKWVINSGTTSVQVSGTNFCLDAGSSPANGVQMKIWTCYSGVAQQTWTYSNNKLALSVQSQCLDLTNGDLTNGNVLQTWQCSAGNTNQIWTTV
ncbi:carbohydrate-binding module family 13 protein [Sphaerobolus stellatus SS14]|uniref:Carbohydrate-binding module family 13 protein n=1 Tax=Sphaerobolus stellatus (strain SS14) TaxID=990650 RepID=A0A0C9VFK5_SPHS4|nr:carbohydrate-binding module family 13 protein [Sphaerobolus stellatus SS14]